MDAKCEKNNYNGPVRRAMEKSIKFTPMHNLIHTKRSTDDI